MKKTSLALTLSSLLLFSAASIADDAGTDVAELKARVKQLELLVEQLLASQQGAVEVDSNNNDALAESEPKGLQTLAEQVDEQSLILDDHQFLLDSASDLTDQSMHIAGYVDVEYKGSSEDGVNEEFRMHHLSLFFTRQFTDKIKFFSEIEYEDAPKFDGVNDGSGDIEEASGTIFVEAMNFDWNYSEYFNVRAGRFFAPAGIWSEDHYPPFVSTQERPMHIFKIFPQFVDGASIFGTAFIGDKVSVDYSAFYGNGESNISGKKDLNNNKGNGLRATFHFPWLSEFTTGFTYYKDGKDTSNNNANKTAYGTHAKFRYKNVTAQLEYAKSDLRFDDETQDYSNSGFYGQFTYELDQLALGYRFDTFDANSLINGAVDRHTVFANYHVNQHVTLKSEYHINQYDQAGLDDFGFYLFSVSAYLGR
ncbi:hypothetical protein ACOI22_15850 [Glaciecola sp. 2405UD65-10]|uniref:hypothetical protein n=1 Tax=Glaciecola sp. 2405UD65-10 TaxID=3397244 RepID=UPI003B5A6943